MKCVGYSQRIMHEKECVYVCVFERACALLQVNAETNLESLSFCWKGNKEKGCCLYVFCEYMCEGECVRVCVCV